MDLDVLDESVKYSGKAARKVYQVEFESLSQNAVEQLIKQDVEHISSIFGVEVNIVFFLVISFAHLV